MGSNVFIAFKMFNTTNITNTTAKRQEYKERKQGWQIMGQPKLEIEKNHLENFKILKLTSENVAKQCKMRQKIHTKTKIRKLTKAAIKQIVT